MRRAVRVSALIVALSFAGVWRAAAGPIDVGTLAWNRVCLDTFATDGSDGLCDQAGGDDTLVFDTFAVTSPGDFTSLTLFIDGSPFQLLTSTLSAGGATQRTVASSGGGTPFTFPLPSVQFYLPGIASTVPGVFSVLLPDTELLIPGQVEDQQGGLAFPGTPFLTLQWEAREIDAPTPVPEPASLALFGSGLALAAARARKQRNKQRE